jgi:hypothetical protein
VTATSTSAVSTAGLDERYVKFAGGLITKYDKNGDGVLTEDEWSGISGNYGEGDTNGDGKLTVEELAVKLSNR